MHHILEIVMPPVADVKAAVGEIMQPFYEGGEDSSRPFWDWWVIGGRWSGHKLTARIPKEKLVEFRAELQARKFTVSSVIFGKEELSPASQAAAVDAMWREWFPGCGEVCPFFQHSGDSSDTDVCTLREVPASLTAFRLIVAAKDYREEKLEAVSMFSQEIWNGVCHEETKWDGNVLDGVAMHRERLKNYKAEYAEKRMPQPDWLVVTVDYHT